MKTQTILAALSLALTLSAASARAQPTPGYNNKMPQEIMTPDTVETRIGALDPWFDNTWRPGEIEVVN